MTRRILIVSTPLVLALACGSPEGNSDESGGDGDGDGGELVQYTPDQANWDTFAAKPFEGGTNTAHDPDDNNNAILRAKWTGELMPNLYCNPDDPDCDPEDTGPVSE